MGQGIHVSSPLLHNADLQAHQARTLEYSTIKYDRQEGNLKA